MHACVRVHRPAAQIGENGLECVNAVKAGVARSGGGLKEVPPEAGRLLELSTVSINHVYSMYGWL